MIFEIEVNNKIILARKGQTILEALEENGIRIPTLCFMKGFSPTGACRMCVVEVEGRNNLVPACSEPVEEWMKIKTHSPRVVQSRRLIVELLLANHPDDCLYCIRNGNCELQNLAEELHVRERHFSSKKNKHLLDLSSSSVSRDPAKCILCGRCVRVCEEVMNCSSIDFVGKGSETNVCPAFSKALNTSTCINCGQCILVCPTAALHEKEHQAEIMDALHNNKKTVVAQLSPSLSVGISETFGLKAGKDISALLYSALKKIGFDYVFDTGSACDIYISELANMLKSRIESTESTPLFSSDCPAWVKYAEQFHADLLPHMAALKSPQQIIGSLIKNGLVKELDLPVEDIYSVSLMPCSSKKFEAQRENMGQQGSSDVDAVLTSRELARMISLHGVFLESLENGFPDAPVNTKSTGARLMGVSGGLTESLIRTLHFLMTGSEFGQNKINELRSNKSNKEYYIKIGKQSIGFAVFSNMTELEDFLKEVRNGRSDIHFVEVMACPGGCVNGGGQPLPASEQNIKARAKSIYDSDEREALKVAHKNPFINWIGKQWFKDEKTFSEAYRTSFIERKI